MIRKLFHLLFDLVAAGSLGAAVWYALSSVVHLSPMYAIAGGAAVAIRIAAGLLRLPRDVRTMTPFALAPLEFAQEEEALLLDRPIEIQPGSRVVRLLHAIPSPGELHETIERHLQAARPQADDAEKLSDAIAQLRRAIR